MDYIFSGNPARVNDYYHVMGNLEGRAVIEAGLTASQFIKNNRVRMDFRNNLSLFVENQLEVLNGDYSELQKKHSMSYLKQEKDYLSHQEFLLRYKKAIVAASITIEFVEEVAGVVGYYVVKGVGIYAGYAQIIAGVALIGGSYATGPGAIIGNIAGVALVVHGLGAIEENVMSLYNHNPDYKGVLRRGYERAAIYAGLSSQQGDIIYGGIDLALSGYGLFRNVMLPEKNRLFYWMYNDTIVGFKDMKGPALTMEMLIDALTIDGMKDLKNAEK